jgi:hypothetical protein
MLIRRSQRSSKLASRKGRRTHGQLTNKGTDRRLRHEQLEDRRLLAAVAVPAGMVSWWTADKTGADLLTRHDATVDCGTE